MTPNHTRGSSCPPANPTSGPTIGATHPGRMGQCPKEPWLARGQLDPVVWPGYESLSINVLRLNPLGNLRD